MAEPTSGDRGASADIERRPVAEDLPAVESLLVESGLPPGDLREKRDRVWTFEADGERVGVGGFERYGTAALLRSVAVVPDRRGEGYGTAIVRALLDLARVRGVEEVYLLTTTAAEFFAGHGFEELPREAAPRLVRATPEFADVCPDSATCMRRDLDVADHRIQ